MPLVYIIAILHNMGVHVIVILPDMGGHSMHGRVPPPPCQVV